MGRPAVVPPAGRGWGVGGAPPAALGGEGGALPSTAPREGWTARRSEPYLGDAEGCVDREGSFLTGRWAAPVGREGGSGWGTPGRGTRPSG